MLVIMHYGPAGNVIAIRAGQDYQVQDVWAVPMVRSDWPPKMADAAVRRLASMLMQWCADRIIVYRDQREHDRYHQDCRRLLPRVPKNKSIIMSLVTDLVPVVLEVQGVLLDSPLQPMLGVLEALRQSQQPPDKLVERTQERFSQPALTLPQALSSVQYILDSASCVLHRKDCPQCPTEGALYGYTSIQQAVGRFPQLCACCRQEYRQALRVRNQKTVQKMQTKYMFNIETGVLHDPKCTRLPSAYHIHGIDDYETAMRRGYLPCKICKPDKTAVTTDQKRKNALELYYLVRRDRSCPELWCNRSKQYKKALTNSQYAYISSGTKTEVHLRSCQCVYDLEHPKGYMHLADALAEGCMLCPECNPTNASDVDAYYPVYDEANTDDGPEVLQCLCRKEGYEYASMDGVHTVKTPVGEWYLDAGTIPMTLDHRNLSGLYGAPKRHDQSVLFLRWRDVYQYIHKHDKQLMLYVRKKEGVHVK